MSEETDDFDFEEFFEGVARRAAGRERLERLRAAIDAGEVEPPETLAQLVDAVRQMERDK